jgi:DNA anti-recombination protein RmuC/MFS family permease
MDVVLWLTLALVVVNLALITAFGLRRRTDGGTERFEREMREEISRSAQGTRVELANALGVFQQTLLHQHASQAQASGEAQDLALKRFSDFVGERLAALSDANERRLAEVRATVEQRLATLQQGNEQKLEQMRATVDEKLHQTLEQRLGESFKQVAERLEQVHRGLGEMQLLAKDVGSLNRVLTNVKTRGIFGEVQLSGPARAGVHARAVRDQRRDGAGTGARVEFAIKLPGRRQDNEPLWLPIDCKFPREDYERLVDAQERADPAGMEAAGRAIEVRLRHEAKTIREKYPGAATHDRLRHHVRAHRGAVCRSVAAARPRREHPARLQGDAHRPTTLLATLSSLQMGFRTLALEKRSAEVWEVLGAVKTEFMKFGDVLAKTKKKLDEASNTIDAAQRRTRAMTRSLKSVEAVPDARVQALIPASPTTSPKTPKRPDVARFPRPLLALILGQVSLHSCMAGVRMAAPLQALKQGHSAWSVGVLMALFALAPIALALPAGRMADRHGYHRPLYVAVALSFAGGVIAALTSHYLAMCMAALLTGAGANVGLITIQRTAGHMAADGTERMRVFSWLGLAPALANVVGPVAAGALIDLAGFRSAFALLMLLPLAALVSARQVEREPTGETAGRAPRSHTSWDLLREPAMRHLLLVNWLVSASWDVHSFLLPILGHERGLAASAIGMILGLFAASVAGVRVVIPLIAHRLSEAQVLAGAMVAVAAIYAVYPLMHAAWTMAICASLLGLALGAVQPMVMSTLHHITPRARHGEAIALRSMTLNLSSTLMPLLFGVAGATLGAASLFWVMGAAVGVGSFPARRMPAPHEETA